jgi:hypothetical protein
MGATASPCTPISLQLRCPGYGLACIYIPMSCIHIFDPGAVGRSSDIGEGEIKIDPTGILAQASVDCIERSPFLPDLAECSVFRQMAE